MRSFSSFADRVVSIATPAAFARTVSRGKWIAARHLLEIDRAILEVLQRPPPRILVIEAPPRHGKSELISKYLPAWFLATHPEKQVLLAGYSSSFARSWGRRARDLIEEWGPSLVGLRVRPDRRAAHDWGLEGHAGTMRTTGAGGGLTGHGADLLIVDDPIKNSEEAQSETMRDKLWDWWQSTARTRLEPNGCAILIATRWHLNDLSGRILAEESECDFELVRRLHLPALAEDRDILGRAPGDALWPQRWPVEELEKLRHSMDEQWWEAMYQQKPGRGICTQWPDEYFPDTIWADDWPLRFDRTVVGCDPATGSERGDYSAAVFLGLVGDRFWVDALICREPPELFVRRVVDLVERHGAETLLIESNLYGALLHREIHEQLQLRLLDDVDLQHARNLIPKNVRISRLGSYLRNRQLRFRRTPGTELLVRQLQEFPVGRHDDGPDALEFALRAAQSTTGRVQRGPRPCLLE